MTDRVKNIAFCALTVFVFSLLICFTYIMEEPRCGCPGHWWKLEGARGRVYWRYSVEHSEVCRGLREGKWR